MVSIRLGNNEVYVEKETENPCEIRNRIKTKVSPNRKPNGEKLNVREREAAHSQFLNQLQNPNYLPEAESLSVFLSFSLQSHSSEFRSEMEVLT